METTKIQWTDATVNFWTGCLKVSDGCKFCYMYRDKERYNQDPRTILRTSPKTFNQALKWSDSKKIFTCSWSDFFIEEADKWRDDAWAIIKATPQHQWQILTKRPERIKQCLPGDWGNGYDNVWLGVSIANESEKYRMQELSNLKTASSKFLTFLSIEPLIGYLDLLNDSVLDRVAFESFDWMIIGGESGNDNGKWKYRECKIEWIKYLIEQANEINIPVFVKQLGTFLSKELNLKDRSGGDIYEWEQSLRIRNFPKIKGTR